MGHAKGPSVARKVFIAFLLPILSFIIVMGVSGKALETRIDREFLRTAISVGIGVLVTCGWIVPVGLKNRKKHNSGSGCALEGEEPSKPKQH
jgi:hypothetical protein